MKKILTLIPSLLLLGALGSRAQTTIYSQDFNASTATPTGWTLMSADNGGTTSTAGNQWLINNTYTPGIVGTATPSQPAGITGGPTSNYLHINCGPSFSGLYGLNANYNATGSGEKYFATTASVVTTGYTAVSLKFWWICAGGASADGKIYYRTSSSGTWTLITTPISSYFGMGSAWNSQTVTMAAFDNQAYLQFGFEFRDGSGGSDPAFAVDDIKVEGTGATTPDASMTASSTTVCSDSCATFTSTSTGTASIDSFKWSCPGATIATPLVSPASICFPDAGTYTVKLYLYDGGIRIDSASTTMTVKQSPAPVIIKTGSTLSVSGAYTSYQWYNGLTPVPGATNASYTYSAPGVYGVMVDSNGCKGVGIKSTLAVGQVNGSGNTFWVARQQGNTLPLIAASPLDEALNVAVYDATGRAVTSSRWEKGTTSLIMSEMNVAPGMYIVRLSNDNTSMVLRWLRE
ncbi:hypothetical protein GCM10023093_26900 [Nemorincola caseinilytica]|uniref:MAM domain-containing protein n=1 Tax=Nemorincola caseinilytica TaxID=2054315 RepID=A0ABP8NNI7_9BACT